VTTTFGIDRSGAAGGSGAAPDVAVADGGTGVSTLDDGGLLIGNGTDAVEVVAPGATTDILVGGGAATAPVWTAATGSGAPVRATSPTLVTPAIGTPASGTLTNCTGYPGTSLTLIDATGDLIYGTAADTATRLPIGSAGKQLRVNAGATAPEWVDMSPVTASLGADVALNNTANYFDGPSIAQGSAGVWFVSGTVSLTDTAGGANFVVKLWDGTTVIASAGISTTAVNQQISASLSGYISAPAANLRISVKDPTSTSGVIKYNASGNSKDSTITAIRIG